MTRKAFNADVESASKKSISGVVLVRKGDDDGEINFQFAPPDGPLIEIGLLALDVPGYPSENSFMIFTKSSEVPSGVNEILEAISSTSSGLDIYGLISNISQRLQKSLAAESQSDPDIDGSSDEEMTYDKGKDPEADGEFDTEEDDAFDDADFPSDEDDFEGFKSFEAKGSDTRARRMSAEAATNLNRRIRSDLRAAKFAGFKLGILRGLKAESHTSVLSISVQVSKLGLSNEVLQAWDLEIQQYIVLLIRYGSGYKTFEEIDHESPTSLGISFRIGICNKYKPSPLEAIAAFTEVVESSNKPEDEPDSNTTRFSSIFISSSLNQYLNDVFICLVKIRKRGGIRWDGAKLFYKNHQGRSNDQNFEFTPEYYKEKPPTQRSLPEMIKADHLADGTGTDISFPLIAAQFAMQSLLRCTEFCLVCHDRLPENFEALKPYVCSNPLCLYQYMSLGFGPSVEHEIMAQPFVVDLLVSFCYAAAYGHKMREYPTGMCLLTPPITPRVAHHATTQQKASPHIIQPRPSVSNTAVAQPTAQENYTKVIYDHTLKEVIFIDKEPCPARNGDWVVIISPSKFVLYAREHISLLYPSCLITTQDVHSAHYRVMDISLYPQVKLSEFAVSASPPFTPNPGYVQDSQPAPTLKAPYTPTQTPPPSIIEEAKIGVYTHNFDDMTEKLKAEAIILLLSTLPSIKEIREYLIQQSRVTEPNLRSWKERISPAALGLLRWIIASNRSCIVQVGKCPGQETNDSSIRSNEKCSNVSKEWVQFRFAQGAPDKEQRFLEALKNEQPGLSKLYPTVFAFHGSPVPNWHSIIRNGLDFKEIAHGRAYGDGVYHALEQVTSSSYVGAWTHYWPNSALKIDSVMSLNEIVNCPSKFVSSRPYLVVQHVDWIQFRYLLVRIASVEQPRDDSDTRSKSFIEIKQDPNFTAKTTLNKPIGVPESAISVSRAFRKLAVDKKGPSKSHKRRKHTSSNDTLSLLETAVSDDEDPEDISFLFSEDEPASADGKLGAEKLVMLNSKTKLVAATTDFIPGSLNQSELPLLNPPSYATPSATMRLNKELQAILKVQQTTPLHELGWYIDMELITNVYQWIVELHSFDPLLPLSIDMKAASLTSIVLEIRFGKDYPHSPPFVRVIKPRFLPFGNGGGGHVTGGGAMCMELLTNSGWSVVSSIESVLLQVRMAIMNVEPMPARLESTAKGAQRSYGTGEAMEAYIRACRTHGWEIPKDFNEFGVMRN